MPIPFTSQEGAQLFQSAPFINWGAIESYTPQENRAFCAIACLQCILAAEAEAPKGFITSRDVFTEQVSAIRRPDQVQGKETGPKAYGGVTIEDFDSMARALFSDVHFQRGESLTTDTFEHHLTATFDTHYWVANYYGPAAGLVTVGHFSTLGAWHPDAQRVLLLDPARHKCGWSWVTTKAMVEAMQVIRPPRGTGRGCVRIAKSS